MSIDIDFTTLLIRQLVNLGEARLSASENILHHPEKGMSCYSGVIFSAKAGRAGLWELDDTMDKLRSFVSRVPGASLEWGTLYGPGPDSEMSMDFGIYYTPPLKPEEDNPHQEAREEDPHKKQADRASDFHRELTLTISRVCAMMKDVLSPYGTIDKWLGHSYAIEEKRDLRCEDFYVPSISVQKIFEPWKEAAFFMFITDGSSPGRGSRLIFSAVTEWLAHGFRSNNADIHLALREVGLRGEMMVLLERKDL